MKVGVRRRWVALASATAVLVAIPAAFATGSGTAVGSAGQVVVASWGGAYQEAQAKAYFEPFEKATGIKVIQDEQPIPAKIKAQVDSGKPQWDVITIGISQMFKLGPKYFAPLQFAKYKKEYAGIPAQFKTSRTVAGAGFCAGIAYRKDMLKPAQRPKSWADFWNLEKFPGPRGMALDGGVPWNSAEAAWIAAGKSPSTLGRMKVATIINQFEKLKPGIGKWWSSGAEALQLLANKEVAMVITALGDVRRLEQQGIPVDVVWNQAFCSWDHWYILKGAKNMDAAQQLVAYMQDPKRQAAFATIGAFGVPSPKAAAFVKSKSLAKYLPTTPGHKPITAYELDTSKWWAKNEEAMVKAFNKWRLG